MKMALKMGLSVTVFLLCLLMSTGALAQAGGLGAAPMGSTFTVPDHAMHASPQSVAQAQSLFPSASTVSVAEGELPLWEVAPEHHEMPLGDAARLQKKEHATDKKARVVWEN